MITTPIVNTQIFQKLKPVLTEAAELLKQAATTESPITIRNHGDCDGYCGGLAMEEALIQLSRGRSVNRISLRAPNYSIGEAASDIRGQRSPRYYGKKGIILLIDDGSTEGDVPGLDLLNIYGVPSIVVDHHPASQEGTRTVYINPYLVGGNGDFTAGMLGVELARMIYPILNVEHLPALSGVGDKVKGSDFEAYLSVAEKHGYTKDTLHKLYLSLDYLASFRREPTTVLRELLLGTKDKQERMIGLIFPIAHRLVEQRLAAVRRLANITEAKGRGVARLEINGFMDNNGFPAAGRSVGLLYEDLKDKEPIVLGVGGSLLIIRGRLPLTINKLVEELRLAFPDSQINGGGHEVAGTIWFIPADKPRIVGYVENLLGIPK